MPLAAIVIVGAMLAAALTVTPLGKTMGTLAVHEAPKAVVELAVKTANLIGDGLYGVDLKQSGDKVVVIEVNDNPNMDAGIEDAYLQDDLYGLVLEEFVRRLELKRQGQGW